MSIERFRRTPISIEYSDDWIIFLLLATAVGILVTAVLEVNWVAEADVVAPTAVVGLLLGSLLALRPIKTVWAWLLIVAYAILISFIRLAHLLPPLSVLLDGWGPLRQYWLLQGASFWDRLAGWIAAVSTNGRSQETIAFALLLGLSAFFLAAVAGWTTFRQHAPFRGLVLMGLILALNGYFGTVEIWLVAFFVGIVALLTSIAHYRRLETEWNANQVDYPEDVRLDLVLYAGAVAIALLFFAFALPAFSISRLQTWFVNLTAVTETESALGEAFGGVTVPRSPGSGSGPGGVGGSGIMPRDYLLGNAPELAETVVMMAVVSLAATEPSLPAPPELLLGTHWRSLSYDVYTGRGWALSEERFDPTPAFQTIPLVSGQSITLSQAVNWLRDDRVIRYTTGLPITFDHETFVSWRGLDDLARVRGTGSSYEAQSLLPVVSPAALRATSVSDVPGALLARYTALPENVPRRVYDLAQDIAGGYDNPYDQARALEEFLRQYPYSLDVPAPPVASDPVDFFLFDLQSGYCDYYASSMVVMARSLGLPARMAVGFLADTPDNSGLQTVRQLDGHSWAEIYFPEQGWIEFEPTAAFTSTHSAERLAFSAAAFQSPQEPPIPEQYTPPPIPEEGTSTAVVVNWRRLVFVALFGLLLLALWIRRRRDRQLKADPILWAFHKLQLNGGRSGYPAAAAQTPTEFADDLLGGLGDSLSGSQLGRLIPPMDRPIQHITYLFNRRRYGDQIEGGSEEAASAWRRLRWSFWLLQLRHAFHRKRM